MNTPKWIDSISPCQVAAVLQSGCASGAYMPAVTYHDALETMKEHGDEVFDFIAQFYGEDFETPTGLGWAQLAVHYLSIAVELWCDLNAHLADWEESEDV